MVVELLYKNFETPLRRLGRDLTTILQNGSVLDAGCGLGELVAELQKHNPNVYGVEYDERAVNEAKQRAIYPEKVIKTDVSNLPFVDEFFDTVVSIGLYASTGQHIDFLQRAAEDPAFVNRGIRGLQEEMIKGINKVLRRGGLYLILDNKSLSTLPTYMFTKLYPENVRGSLSMILQK